MRTFQKILWIPLVCAVAFMVQGLTGPVASAAYDLSEGPIRYDWDFDDFGPALYYADVPEQFYFDMLGTDIERPTKWYEVLRVVGLSDSDLATEEPYFAFTYDKETGVFTTYVHTGANAMMLYSQCKFVNSTTLQATLWPWDEGEAVGYDDDGWTIYRYPARTGIMFHKDDGGRFMNPQYYHFGYTNVDWTYTATCTDAMLIYEYQCVH